MVLIFKSRIKSYLIPIYNYEMKKKKLERLILDFIEFAYSRLERLILMPTCVHYSIHQYM